MRIKNLISFLMIIGVIAIGCQAVSAQFRTTPVNNNSRCDRSRLSPIKCGFYEEGYLDGANDARNNRSEDYTRYRRKYSGQYQSNYIGGYQNGYRGGNTNSSWTKQQRTAYDLGYEFGDDDRRRRVSRLPARYEGRYERVYESFYRRGYSDGYDRKARQYDTNTGTRFPNRPVNRRRGTATGRLNWKGRVDNRVNIILKSDQVETKQVAGRITGVSKNLNGVLPRNATVSARKLDGRGDVRVIQQPSRANQGTAIIQVSDPRRGADNYNLQITWQGSRTQERYSPGKLTWRGRVDGTVDIRISDDYAEAIDKSSSGMRVMESNLEGYLAARNGTVRVNKRDGRGTVSVVEQPSRQNDYTAVIRIFDPRGGDDEYELEVIW